MFALFKKKKKKKKKLLLSLPDRPRDIFVWPTVAEMRF